MWHTTKWLPWGLRVVKKLKGRRKWVPEDASADIMMPEVPYSATWKLLNTFKK